MQKPEIMGLNKPKGCTETHDRPQGDIDALL